MRCVIPSPCDLCLIGEAYLRLTAFRSSGAQTSCQGGPFFLDRISGWVWVVPKMPISTGVCVPLRFIRRATGSRGTPPCGSDRVPSRSRERAFKIETAVLDSPPGGFDVQWPTDGLGILAIPTFLVLRRWCGGSFPDVIGSVRTTLPFLSLLPTKHLRVRECHQGRYPSRSSGVR